MQQGRVIAEMDTQVGGHAPLSSSLSDEQILGLEPAGADAPGGDGSTVDHFGEAVGSRGEPTAQASHEAWGSDNAAGRAARQQEMAGADRTGSPGAQQDEPAWLKSLEAQPEAAAEARQWRDAANDVAALDAAYFSGDSGARAGLAARLYESDPAAFRAMLTEGARMLGQRDPQAVAELAQLLGVQQPAQNGAAANPRSLTQAARDAGAASPLSPQQMNRNAASRQDAQLLEPQTQGAFPAEAYRAFESAANEDVARRVHDAIDRTLNTTLPQGVPPGAQRRIGDDIFREVHASLSSDRELARQIGEALANWRFDATARQQVTALLAGRARAVLPEVSRRVVAEWTSSVLASDRAKNARIDAATSRRDVTGGRLPEPVSGGTLRPRDIDYTRTSDAQILDM